MYWRLIVKRRYHYCLRNEEPWKRKECSWFIVTTDSYICSTLRVPFLLPTRMLLGKYQLRPCKHVLDAGNCFQAGLVWNQRNLYPGTWTRTERTEYICRSKRRRLKKPISYAQWKTKQNVLRNSNLLPTTACYCEEAAPLRLSRSRCGARDCLHWPQADRVAPFPALGSRPSFDRKWLIRFSWALKGRIKFSRLPTYSRLKIYLNHNMQLNISQQCHVAYWICKTPIDRETTFSFENWSSSQKSSPKH